MDRISLILQYVVCELANPLNYAVSVLIGVTINYFQGIGIFSSPVPFLVPIIVQAVSKASVKMANRQTALLAKLPGQRQDPTFVIDANGKIVAMAGKTRQLLNQKNIGHLNQLLGTSYTAFLHPLQEEGQAEIQLNISALQNTYVVKGSWHEPYGLLWFTRL